MFNQAVDRVLELVSKDRPSDVNPSIIRLESYFNYAQPFTHASRIYILAFVLERTRLVVLATRL